MSEPDHLQRLAALVDLLRSKGVRMFRESSTSPDGTLDSVELELEPTVFEHEPEKSEPDPDVCRCGHASHEHGPDGLCLRGCEVEACQPRESK